MKHSYFHSLQQNNRVQPISKPHEQDNCSVPADVIVLFDVSASIPEEELPSARAFLSELVNALHVSESEIHMGIYTFNQTVTPIQNLTSSTEELLSAINSIQSTDAQTNISAALNRADGYLIDGRREASDIIILFTDGNDNSNPITTANTLKNNNVLIIVVGIGTPESTNTLRDIATNNYFFRVNELNELNEVLDEVLVTTSCVGQVYIQPNGTVIPLATPTDITHSPSPTESTISAQPMSESNSILPDIPASLEIPAFILLLLILGFLSWMLIPAFFKNRSQPINVSGTRKSGAAPGPEYTQVNKFEETLKQSQITYPPPPRNYAQFHSRMMIIGIGHGGAKILDDIVERIDDTNLFASVSDVRGDQNSKGLIMMHLGISSIAYGDKKLPKYKNHENKNIIECFDINQNSDHPIDDMKKGDRWEWARINKIIYRSTGRYSARVALFKDLEFGPNAPLLHALDRHLQIPVDTIYLVGSAQDYVGANLMGDLAALIRYKQPHRSFNIHALIAAEEDEMEPSASEKDHRAYLGATIYELGRLSTPGRVKIKYGPGIEYTSDELLPVINGVNLFYGKDSQGIHNVTNVLWGQLTNKAYYRHVKKLVEPKDGRDEHTPSITVSFSHSLRWPVRILREKLISSLMLKFIEDNTYPLPNIAPHDCNTEEIQNTLNKVRNNGLLPSLLLLRASAICVRRDENGGQYLTNIINNLETRRERYQKNARELQSKRLNSNIYTIPEALSNWASSSHTSESLVQLRDRIGWVVQPNPVELAKGFLVRMDVARNPHESTGRPEIKHIYETKPENLDKYVGTAEEMAKRIIYNVELDQIIQNFQQSLNKPKADQFRIQWAERYRTWRESWKNIFVQIELKPSNTSMGIPKEWNIPELTDDFNSTENSDETFALQSMIIPRIPIRNLEIIKNSRYIQDVFVHKEERITLDVFNGDVKKLSEIPATLQDALAHREAMWIFYQVWRAGGSHKIFQTIGNFANAYDDNLKYLDLTMDFIKRYESEQRFRDIEVGEYLKDHQEMLAKKPSNDTFVSDGTNYGEYLIEAFKNFTDPDKLKRMEFYPPEISQS